ncbi:hypothetical protein QE152_g32509 [Popillia japonica]|uniref:Uncharacterized protein n=1 Tax=Popillia japonica TaxID=7064 RepID=A0AAW1IYS9_POPJA
MFVLLLTALYGSGDMEKNWSRKVQEELKKGEATTCGKPHIQSLDHLAAASCVVPPAEMTPASVVSLFALTPRIVAEQNSTRTIALQPSSGITQERELELKEVRFRFVLGSSLYVISS